MGVPLVRSGAVGRRDGSGSDIGRSEGEEDIVEAGTAQRHRGLGGLTDPGGQRRGDPTDGAVRGDLGQMGAVGAADGHGVLSDSRLERPRGAQAGQTPAVEEADSVGDRKSTRLNSSHVSISYSVFCLKK